MRASRTAVKASCARHNWGAAGIISPAPLALVLVSVRNGIGFGPVRPDQTAGVDGPAVATGTPYLITRGGGERGAARHASVRHASARHASAGHASARRIGYRRIGWRRTERDDVPTLD